MIGMMDERGTGIGTETVIGILRQSAEVMIGMMVVIGTAIRNESGRDRIGMMAARSGTESGGIATGTETETETTAVIRDVVAARGTEVAIEIVTATEIATERGTGIGIVIGTGTGTHAELGTIVLSLLAETGTVTGTVTGTEIEIGIGTEIGIGIGIGPGAGVGVAGAAARGWLVGVWDCGRCSDVPWGLRI